MLRTTRLMRSCMQGCKLVGCKLVTRLFQIIPHTPNLPHKTPTDKAHKTRKATNKALAQKYQLSYSREKVTSAYVFVRCLFARFAIQFLICYSVDHSIMAGFGIRF